MSTTFTVLLQNSREISVDCPFSRPTLKRLFEKVLQAYVDHDKPLFDQQHRPKVDNIAALSFWHGYAMRPATAKMATGTDAFLVYRAGWNVRRAEKKAGINL